MHSTIRLIVVSIILISPLVQGIHAQDASTESPPPAWQGQLGAGLALTSGNADTSNFNITFELQWDAGAKHDLS